MATGKFAFTSRGPYCEPDLLSGASLNRENFCRGDDVDAFGGKKPLDLLGDIKICVGNELG